jgi:hypothetical protein
MKIVTIILAIIAIGGASEVITGVRSWSYSSQGGSIVSYASVPDRILSIAVAMTFGTAAYGCMRRTKWAWGFVRGILWFGFGASVLWLVVCVLRFHGATDNPNAVSDVILKSFVQIAIWGWLLFDFWPRRRRGFSGATQIEDPMTTLIPPSKGKDPRKP